MSPRIALATILCDRPEPLIGGPPEGLVLGEGINPLVEEGALRPITPRATKTG